VFHTFWVEVFEGVKLGIFVNEESIPLPEGVLSFHSGFIRAFFDFRSGFVDPMI
jgi:hypothetical protein